MNCKPGDMEIIVKSFSGNEGKIVTCIEFLGQQQWWDPIKKWCFEDTWLIDRALSNVDGQLRNCICDNQLMPIRHGDLQDETEDATDRKVTA